MATSAPCCDHAQQITDLEATLQAIWNFMARTAEAAGLPAPEIPADRPALRVLRGGAA